MTLNITAWNKPALRPHHSELESISGLLDARGGSEVKSLANAKRIIRDLSSSPSCAFAPTARLLHQCKIIKPRTENLASDQQKANVQATYGISMALCEAQQAQILTPSRCQLFEALLERQVPDASTEIVRQSEIEFCMNALFGTSSWTSYITFRAQSADLCDSSRVDYQREELLHTFRQATNVIPDILEALREQQYETHLTMTGVRDMTQEVAASQQDVISSNQEQARQAKEHLRQMSDYIETYMQLVQESGKLWQESLKEGVDQASKDLALMNDKAMNVQINFAELYATAAEALSGLMVDFENNVELMTKEVNRVVEHIFDLNVDDHVQKLRLSMSLGQVAATDFATAQQAQKQMAEEQMEISHGLLQVIKDSHGQFHQIKQTLDLIPSSWIDTLHQIQGSIARIRSEVKYALLFVVPTFLLLLFGRARSAFVTILIYVFARSLWSIANSLHLSLSDIPIEAEDLQMLVTCMFSALCVGATVIYIGRLLHSLFARSSVLHRSSKFEEAAAESIERLGSHLRFQSLPRYQRRHTLKEPGKRPPLFTSE